MQLVIGNKNYSSWSLRPWLGMKVAGIEFNEVAHDLFAPNALAARFKFAPSGKVPVLIDADLHVWDTLAIAEYLAERYPAAKLWPQDIGARAYARSVCAEMHAGFSTLRTLCPMDVVQKHSVVMTPALQVDIDRILAIWHDCRVRFAEQGPFLFGHFTWADAFFAPVVTRFVTYGISVPAPLNLYMNSVLSLPAMQEWLADAQIELSIVA